ncbi:hypothetical protein RSOL_190360 [Rhizoctonia solani AG-3 Rhs1AP]|uniref:Uncharacterized protein n=2 Tax=Rhizoctonia solani AG-3 TaxID=1086053 RepID=A0A074RVX8_9AGAM|nr:hypothetical protein RSOL_190360 [Rhizoctonia solani AG-3 Rhs1AP]KEP51094.1 hypothetical protein V565_067710 [Rhizoctonia solani 123E]
MTLHTFISFPIELKSVPPSTLHRILAQFDTRTKPATLFLQLLLRSSQRIVIDLPCLQRLRALQAEHLWDLVVRSRHVPLMHLTRAAHSSVSILSSFLDAPNASTEQLYDTLMSIYYQPNSPNSAPKVYIPVPGSLPVDPTTLHWFTTELVKRASVSGVVLKLALSYMVRARSAALRACEAQVPAPISPPPSPLYPSHMDSRRSRSPCGPMAVPGPELADPRQLLLGSLVLAQKFLIDAAYTSATWGKLSGLSASNVAAVERTLGTALDWRLWDKNL